jgi:hypothetical protein
MLTRNGRILLSFGNWIAVFDDHSCREGIHREDARFLSSICEPRPLNARLRTLRFCGLPTADGRGRGDFLPRAPICTGVRMLENSPRECKIVQASANVPRSESGRPTRDVSRTQINRSEMRHACSSDSKTSRNRLPQNWHDGTEVLFTMSKEDANLDGWRRTEDAGRAGDRSRVAGLSGDGHNRAGRGSAIQVPGPSPQIVTETTPTRDGLELQVLDQSERRVNASPLCCARNRPLEWPETMAIITQGWHPHASRARTPEINHHD